MAASAEVHVMGLYSAKRPESAAYNRAVKKHLALCQKKPGCDWGGGWDRIERRFPGQMTVNVTRTGAPITLVLSAYEHTVWTVRPAAGVTIERVIMSGYHKQKVILTGSAATAKVKETHYGENAHPDHFFFLGDDTVGPETLSTYDGETVRCPEDSEKIWFRHKSDFQKTLKALARLKLVPTSIQSSGEDLINSFDVGPETNSTVIPVLRPSGYCYRNEDGILVPGHD